VCLALCLMLIQAPQWFGLEVGPDATLAEKSLPARVGFLFVAVWWAAFSIPFFRHVREPELARESDELGRAQPFRSALRRLLETGRELRTFRHAFIFLLAFFAYNEGIGTVIRMATLLGDERGIATDVLIQCILLVQFVGVPASLAFGKLAHHIGAKRSILLAVVVYTGIAFQAYRLSTPTEFLVLALCVGLVQGGAQALSRSLFASMIPARRSGEFFGLFAVLEKFAGLAGPAFFTLASMTTGSSRAGLVSVVLFFAVGGLLLARVDIAEGQRAARAAEAA